MRTTTNVFQIQLYRPHVPYSVVAIHWFVAVGIVTCHRGDNSFGMLPVTTIIQLLLCWVGQPIQHTIQQGRHNP